MNIRTLLEFVAHLCELNEPAKKEIVAVLIYRDASGSVVRKEVANFGFCSGVRPELTVEMGTARPWPDGSKRSA